MVFHQVLNPVGVIGTVLLSAAAVLGDARPLPRPLATASKIDQVATQPRPRPSSGERDGSQSEASPCGGTAIVAERLPPVAEADACGVAAPVRVRSIAGVALDPPSVVTCEMALRVLDWLEASAKPAFEASGAPLTKLDIAAAYVCRNVNYSEDGDVSEHAFGRALDISRFRRADGTVVSVRDDWGSPPHGDLLRTVHEDACGVFSTTLGPESNALHADHFHYDIADRRRPYCPDRAEPN